MNQYEELRPPEPTGDCTLLFNKFEQKHGPYIIRIGEITIELDDPNSKSCLTMSFECDGRRIEIHKSKPGNSPIEISVRMATKTGGVNAYSKATDFQVHE